MSKMFTQISTGLTRLIAPKVPVFCTCFHDILLLDQVFSSVEVFVKILEEIVGCFHSDADGYHVVIDD